MTDCDSERLKAYIQGWDDAVECVQETMAWIPDEHLVAVVRLQRERATRDA